MVVAAAVGLVTVTVKGPVQLLDPLPLPAELMIDLLLSLPLAAATAAAACCGRAKGAADCCCCSAAEWSPVAAAAQHVRCYEICATLRC